MTVSKYALNKMCLKQPVIITEGVLSDFFMNPLMA